jgi:hypothetical protein
VPKSKFTSPPSSSYLAPLFSPLRTQAHCLCSCETVVKGPAEFCIEKKDHEKFWGRGGHDENETKKEREGKHHCYSVPQECALLKSPDVPKVVCEKDWSIKDAERVRWKHEWEW